MMNLNVMRRLLVVRLAGAVLVDTQGMTKFAAVLGDLKQNVMQSIVESPSFSNLMHSIPESASFANLKESMSDKVTSSVSDLTDSILNVMPDLDVQKLGKVGSFSSYYSSFISQATPKMSVESLDKATSSDSNQTETRFEEGLESKNSSSTWIDGADDHSDIAESEALAASTEEVAVDTDGFRTKANDDREIAGEVLMASAEDVAVDEGFRTTADDDREIAGDVIFTNESETSENQKESVITEADSTTCTAQHERISALQQEIQRLMQVKNTVAQAKQDGNKSLLVVYPGVELLKLFLEALHELANQAYTVLKPQLQTSLNGMQPLVGGTVQAVTSGGRQVINHTLEAVTSGAHQVINHTLEVSNRGWATGSAMVNQAINRSWSHCEELLTTALNATHLAGVKWNVSATVNPAVRDAFNQHLASLKSACGDVNKDVVKPYMEVATVALLETQKFASDWAADVAPMTVAKELGDFLWDAAQQEVQANLGPTNLILFDGTVIHFPYGLLDMTILGIQVVAMLWLVVWRIGFKVLFWQILVQTLAVQFVIHTLLVGSLASVWALFVGTLYFAWMIFLGVADLMLFRCCCCCSRRRKGLDKGSWLSTFSISIPLVSTVCLCTVARYWGSA